jgi:hypothetical protein
MTPVNSNDTANSNIRLGYGMVVLHTSADSERVYLQEWRPDHRENGRGKQLSDNRIWTRMSVVDQA